MELILKQIGETGRSMYLYYPNKPVRTAFKRCSITLLRDDAGEASVRRLLEAGLAELAEREELILVFPNPVGGRWNYALDPAKPDDLADFPAFQEAMTKPDNDPPKLNANGIPSFESMLGAWHPMNDTKYLVGLGSGAAMACALAAAKPDNIAAVLSLGGSLAPVALGQAVDAPMPVCLAGADEATLAYFVRANGARLVDENDRRRVYESPVNPLQCVVALPATGADAAGLITETWEKLFRRVRRANTGLHGDIQPRMDLKAAGFEIFLDDDRLEEPVKTPHTWFTHVPASVKAAGARAPLMLFFHGASDSPAEAAEMSKFHELGEREGFITVYPWGTNKATWNSDMAEDAPDDVGFAVALIHYMCAHYPVDPTRVYLSGFSNGAAHAQVVAMVHPELIAAICHIDSNWPGRREGPTDIRYEDITPMRLGLEKKKSFDYRMPVWYTYGTREPSYPVYRGCSQQHQYDYWKRYNNIEVAPTPPQEAPHPCGCGVPGQRSTHLAPSARHPHHHYDVQTFFAEDAPELDLYNYVIMRDKGHDVAEMDPALGWAYVKRFRRLPGGGLEVLQG